MGQKDRAVKKNVARANKVIKGVKKGGEIVGAVGVGAAVFVKAHGPELIKQAPAVAKKVAAVAKNFI